MGSFLVLDQEKERNCSLSKILSKTKNIIYTFWVIYCSKGKKTEPDIFIDRSI